MKPDVFLRPEAETDIDGIADFTIARWGKEQARTYVASLRADIASLAHFPLRCPSHRAHGIEFRKMVCGQHLVFYVIAANIEVVRVIHVSRDIEAELG